MKQNFKTIYLHMLYQQAGIIHFDLNFYTTYIKTGVLFNNNINQSRQMLIDVPQQLIKFCLENQNKIIEFSKIKQLMKNSKHYVNIKNINGPNLYFNIFDFSKDVDINSFHFQVFKITNDQELKESLILFKQKCENSSGFFGIYNEHLATCLINQKSLNIKQTIYHQLSHFIQQVCNIRVTTSTEFNKTKISKQLEILDITFDQIIYYFNRFQFSTHMDDLIKGLQTVYETFYKNISKINFILNILIPAIKHIETIKTNQLFLNYQTVNSDISPFLMLIGSYLTKHKYQKIMEIIKKRFIILHD